MQSSKESRVATLRDISPVFSMQSSKESRVIQGNEAALEGAILAGCRFFAGYPITPASEFSELASSRLPKIGGVYIQMEDEIASINVLAGASWGGMKVMTATSGPGFSLMQEGIGYAYVTQSPCVIVDVMRGGPAIGQATMSSQQDVYQARYGTHGEYEAIVLAPSSAQECLDMTVRAFNLSERYLTPVIVLMDEVVGHTREKVLIPDSVEVETRRLPPDGVEYKPFLPIAENRHVPYRRSLGQGAKLLVEPQLHDWMGNRCGHLPEASALCLNRLRDKIRKNLDDIIDVTCMDIDGAETVIVGYGSSARSALRAAREGQAMGKRVGFVKLNTIFPFPDELFADITKRCASNVVFAMPEMNSGRLYREVMTATRCEVISIAKLGGELPTPAEIIRKIWG